MNTDRTEEQLARTALRCRERDILIPTFAELKDPRRIPPGIAAELAGIGLSDLHPRNLFRITWKNDPASGKFGPVNAIELPRSLTGVRARIFALVGKYFPTGAHKVGAAFGCLVPRLVTGAFDPTRQKAVWPSTGNYCRGGAWNSRLLACDAVAILPEGMSRERFEWLGSIGAEIIKTPGSESNVKEIYDKCWEIERERGDAVVVLNQFAEFGNGMFHYEVTAAAIDEVLSNALGSSERFAGFISATGSAGTIAAGDRLRELYPAFKVVAAEALQCPTLLRAGFGEHRIEGIGDKHVPWIHNVLNTDLVVAVDDAAPLALIRLFNEPAGRALLAEQGVDPETLAKLDLAGISGAANLLAAIKTALWFELDERDTLFTVFTDSMDLYRSRLAEAARRSGPYDRRQAELDLHLHLRGQRLDHMRELTRPDRQQIHNLKYYTWVEQQKKSADELRRQWNDRDYWTERFGQADAIDRLIAAFNERSGMQDRAR